MVAPPDAQEPWQSSAEQPLIDPFVGKAPPPPPKPPLAPAALASALLSLLPIGSVAAIPVGVVGLRQTRLGTLRGRWLAVVSIVLGSLASLAYGGAAAYVAVDYVSATRREAVLNEERRERRQKELEEEELDASRVVPAPLIVPHPVPSGDPPGGTVPQDTKVAEQGKISVVELGVSEPSLRAALIREIGTAKAGGKQVMVMTLRAGCDPCDGVMKALADKRMQDALERVRLVRVDIKVFAQELEQLGMQRDGVPGFFLLSSDGSPRDAIDGGEWNEDIPQNIAPVLGPFVRGEYKKRRKEYKPAPGGGVFL